MGSRKEPVRPKGAHLSCPYNRVAQPLVQDPGPICELSLPIQDK